MVRKMKIARAAAAYEKEREEREERKRRQARGLGPSQADLQKKAKLEDEAKRKHLGVALPEGWVREYDDGRSHHYYYNEMTGVSVWRRPGGYNSYTPTTALSTSVAELNSVELVQHSVPPVAVGTLVTTRDEPTRPNSSFSTNSKKPKTPPDTPPTYADEASIIYDELLMTCGYIVCWCILY